MFKLLRRILGCILMIASIGLGIYTGFWLMFVNGIVQIVNSITPEINALGIAFGIVRIMFASVIGYITFFISLVIGRLLIE